MIEGKRNLKWSCFSYLDYLENNLIQFVDEDEKYQVEEFLLQFDLSYVCNEWKEREV